MNPAMRAGTPLRARGFTLLELMVVVVIIAVIVSLAVLSLGSNSGRQLDTEAQRFKALIRLAADEAVLQSREIGLRIKDDGYEFLVYDDQLLSWTNMEQDTIYRPRQLPDTVTLTLYVDDQELVLPLSEDEEDGEIAQPQVLLLSSGEMTPFEVVMEMEIADREVVLRGLPNGVVEEVGPDDL